MAKDKKGPDKGGLGAAQKASEKRPVTLPRVRIQEDKKEEPKGRTDKKG